MMPMSICKTQKNTFMREQKKKKTNQPYEGIKKYMVKKKRKWEIIQITITRPGLFS